MSKIFYSDNNNRQNRVVDLVGDCNALISLLSENAREMSTVIKELDEQLYQSYKQTQKEYKKEEFKLIELNEFIVRGSKLIACFFTYRGTTNAIEKAFKVYLIRQERYGEAAFVELVGLPSTWMKLTKIAGGVLVSEIISEIIEAVNEATKKGGFKNAIHTMIPKRIELKKALIINNDLLVELSSMKKFIDNLAYYGYKQSTPEEMQLAWERSFDKYKLNFEKTDWDAKTESQLATEDKMRNSWTNEDTE